MRTRRSTLRGRALILTATLAVSLGLGAPVRAGVLKLEKKNGSTPPSWVKPKPKKGKSCSQLIGSVTTQKQLSKFLECLQRDVKKQTAKLKQELAFPKRPLPKRPLPKRPLPKRPLPKQPLPKVPKLATGERMRAPSRPPKKDTSVPRPTDPMRAPSRPPKKDTSVPRPSTPQTGSPPGS